MKPAATKIIAVNAARETAIEAGGKTYQTGIFKQPLTGPAKINTLGIEGDTIVDTRVHGGEDQALYLYSLEDYQWWSQQLGRELPAGCFGENLTISAFHDQPLKIGDRLTIADTVELEITAPRVPCLKLASRMGDPTFGKQFVAAQRPGAYARVIRSGEVTAGDPIQWQPTERDYATVGEVFVEWHNKEWSEQVFKKALASPISVISRRIIEERFSR